MIGKVPNKCLLSTKNITNEALACCMECLEESRRKELLREESLREESLREESINREE